VNEKHTANSVAVESEEVDSDREAEPRPGSAPPETPEAQPESRTRSMLREAIQKVMEEIEHHEKEAKKHMKQAEALRRDLRESVAFLMEQGKGKPIAVPAAKRAAKASETHVKENATETPAPKRGRGRAKRK